MMCSATCTAAPRLFTTAHWPTAGRLAPRPPARRLRQRPAAADAAAAARLVPPSLGNGTLPGSSTGQLSPVGGGLAGASIGALYALTCPDPQRARVASWAAPLVGALGGPCVVAGLADPAHCLVAVALGVGAYRGALAPLLRRQGADAASDELCRLATALGCCLLAAAGR